MPGLRVDHALMAEHALTIVDVFPPKFPRFRFADNTTPHSRVQQALYRNPETGKTFTGRGAKPGWLRQALSDGRSMAAFLVTKPLPAGPNAVSMKIALKAAAAFPVEPDPAADARPGGSRGRKWDKEMLGFQPRLLPSLPALREDRRAAAWDLDAMGCNAVNGRGTVPCRGMDRAGPCNAPCRAVEALERHRANNRATGQRRCRAKAANHRSLTPGLARPPGIYPQTPDQSSSSYAQMAPAATRLILGTPCRGPSGHLRHMNLSRPLPAVQHLEHDQALPTQGAGVAVRAGASACCGESLAGLPPRLTAGLVLGKWDEEMRGSHPVLLSSSAPASRQPSRGALSSAREARSRIGRVPASPGCVAKAR